MIVAAAFPVAFFPPAADIAMTDWLRIRLARADVHGLLESTFHDAKIGGKGGQPIGLGLESNVWANNVEELRLRPLQLREKLGIEAQLKNGLRLCFACEV